MNTADGGTPVTLLAAPGAGLVTVPHQFIAVTHPGATPYANGSSINWIIGPSVNGFYAPIIPVNGVTAAASAIEFTADPLDSLVGLFLVSAQLTNQAVTINLDPGGVPGTPFTAGN